MTPSLVQNIQSEEDLARILAEMTLEEKAGQLNQPPNLDQISDQDVRDGKIGTIICAYNAFAGNEKHNRVRVDLINRLQKIAVEESRLGIPIVFARDVIHGYRTIAPIPLGQGASFSPAHVRAAFEVAAMEASADGIRWAFSPMLDIGRDPRWGRVAEGFGEDPYLTSQLGAAAVQGFQGEDITVAACFKHFAGYGTAEGGRDYNSGEITEHTYRNVILRPFHAAVKAGALTAMAAFLEVGGEAATCNTWLLKTILRDEWGFDGAVVSDWNAVHEIVDHGRATDDREATTLALTAGTDIDMAANAYLEHIPELVRSGILAESVVDQAVLRVLKLKFRLGLFKNAQTDPKQSETRQFTASSQKTTLELAHRSLVLVKNDQSLLPLVNKRRVVVFGPLAVAQSELFGTWTLDGIADDVVTIKDALRKVLPESTQLVHTNLADEAVSQSRNSDVCIAVLGESPHRSGENNSISDLGLPAGQLDQLRALSKVGVKTVAVILTGRALDLSEVEPLCDAIIVAFHPGTMGGIAIADTLVGKNNPSGKLPMTFPRHAGQVPLYYARKATGRPTDPTKRGESRLIDNQDSPLYPFGFGLTYSHLEVSEAKLEDWRVSATVNNPTNHRAEEVVQLYMRDEVAQRVRPVKELIGFQRLEVPANTTVEAQFDLVPDDFGYYGAQGKWVIEPGWFSLSVGNDSTCSPFVRIRLDENLKIVESMRLQANAIAL